MNRWKKYNPNPRSKRVGDCAIRACCLATGRTWDEVFDNLADIAFRQKDVLSANAVWGEYLRMNGYGRYDPDFRMTVADFCADHPRGTYVLGLDGHVLTVMDGMYYDTWDSGERYILYYWKRV